MISTTLNPQQINTFYGAISCESLNNYGALLQIFKCSNFCSYISVPFTPFR
jgi:hypothetical protein